MQVSLKKSSFDQGPSIQPPVSGLPSEVANGYSSSKQASAGLFRILVVEDDPFLQSFYGRVLTDAGYSFDVSDDGHEALEKLSATYYDLVVTDLNLPGLDGITLLQWIQRHRPATTAVVVSGDGSADRILAAMREGAKDYLVKPIALPEFRAMIERWSQPRHHVDRHVFSSIIKQVMHDVRGEVVNLEIIIKQLQKGKAGSRKDGINSALLAMQAKLEHLKGLATDYCLLAKNLLQGGGNIQTERLKLKEDVITPVLEEMVDAMQRKEIGLSFQQDLAVADDAYVTGNRVMLKCVFRTLFGNAIKYCKDASVISYGISTNNRRYKIHVANVGEVVPAHLQASIFEEFVQAPTGDLATCQTEGLGLGLALAKEILRQHGGDIWYEAMAKGSKFICTLPAHSTQPVD